MADSIFIPELRGSNETAHPRKLAAVAPHPIRSRALRKTGCVEDAVEFAPDVRLTYALERSSETHSPRALYQHGSLRIQIPPAEADNWANTDRVGISGGEGIRIAVEKDFKCMHGDSERRRRRVSESARRHAPINGIGRRESSALRRVVRNRPWSCDVLVPFSSGLTAEPDQTDTYHEIFSPMDFACRNCSR